MTMIFLTRPEGENESLATLLAKHKVNLLIRPLIELSPIEIDKNTEELLTTIDQQYAIAFVSKSSVRYALPLLENYWPQWPSDPRWLAVGPGTATELAGFGIRADYPAVAGSEGLLELPALLTVSGTKVLIVRGVGGREHLATSLERRGAQVTYLEVYRRSPLENAHWPAVPAGSVIVVTSVEAMGYLSTMAGEAIDRCRFVVASPRIAAAGNRSWETIIAAGASDRALYDAVLSCL